MIASYVQQRPAAMMPRKDCADFALMLRSRAASLCSNCTDMEDHLPNAAPADPWSEQFARTLRERRERAQQLLQAERDRIQQIERTLAEQLRKVMHELQQDVSAAECRDHGL